MSTNRDSIRIKRGMSAELPESLPLGELAFCIDTRELWVGSGDGLALKRVTNTEITQHLDEWNALYTEVDERFETKYVDVSAQFSEKFNELCQQFATKSDALDTQFANKYSELSQQFQNKYNNLEREYAQQVHSAMTLSADNKQSIDLLKRDIGTTANIEDLQQVNNQATETLEQLNQVKTELESDVLVIKDIEKDTKKAHIDYEGNHHDSLKDSMDANIDFIKGEFNTTHMTGENITCENTILRHVKQAEMRGHTELNCIKEPSGKEVVLPYEFDETQKDFTLEDTKDTGSLNIVLKGNTEVNVLKNPMRDYVVPYEFEEGYTATLTDTKETGSIQSAILKGQTLVNICKPFEFDIQTTGSGLRHLKDNVDMLNIPLDDNKNYSVWVEIDINEIGAFSVSYTGAVASLVFDSITHLTLTGGSVVAYPCVKRKDSSNTNFSIGAMPGSTEGRLKGRIMVFEGDVRGLELSYFEGMQSVNMPVLKTTGKNLWNTSILNSIPINSYYQDTGLTLKELCPDLVVGETYIASMRYDYTGQITGTVGVALIPFLDITNHPFTYTDDLKDCRVYVYGGNATGTAYDFQIEKGSVATPYEPYKSNILTVNEEVVLRGIGDVKDELNCLTGEVTERIGEIVLDGSESWTINNGGTLTNTLWFATDKFDTIKKVGTVVNTDKLSYNHNLWNEDKEGIKVEGSAQQVRIRILKSKLTTQDVNGFKQYLSQNPITVQYELATPVIKTVDLSILDQDGLSVPALSTYNEVTYINTTVPENSLKPLISSKTPEFPVMIKPNTKYSIVADTTTNGFDEIPLTYNLGGAEVETSVGEKLTVIQTPSTLENETFKVTGTGMKLSNVMILEKDLTGKEIPNYTEGMNSVKVSEIKTTGKNLFNAYACTLDKSSHPSLIMEVKNSNSIRVALLDSPTGWRAGFINYQLEPNSWYKIRCTVTGDLGLKELGFYVPEVTGWNPDSRGCVESNNFLGHIRTLDSGIVTMRFNGSGAESTTFDLTYSNIQIEKVENKDVAHSSYEAYKESKVTFPEVELNGLGEGSNRVEDTLNLKTGILTRYTGVLNLTRNTPNRSQWLSSQVAQGMIGIYFRNEYIDRHENQYGLIANDKLPVGYRGNLQNITQDSIIKGNGYIGIVKKADSVEEVLQWLDDNPVKVIYPMLEPFTTTIDVSGSLKTWNTKTHFFQKISEGALNPIISHKDLEYEVLLKPNTKYSIITNPISNGHANSPISFDLGGQQVETTVGSYCTLVTTPSTLTHDKLVMKGRGNKLSGGVMIFDGDKTGMRFSHFDGMKSVESPVVKTTKKNILDSNRVLDYEYATVVEIDGERWADFDNRNPSTNKIKLETKPNTAYTLTFKGITDDREWGIRPTFYYSDGTTDYLFYNPHGIPSYGTSDKNKTLTHISFDVPWSHLNKNTRLSLDVLQLEESPTNTEFEPYEANTLTLPQQITLRKSGNVEDTLDLVTGEYVQRIGVGLITENDHGGLPYGHGGVNENTIALEYNKNSTIFRDGTLARSSTPYLCPTLPFQVGIDVAGNYIAKYSNVSDSVIIRVNGSNKTEALEWLAENPITFLYELATPKVTKVELAYDDGKLFAYDGTTHFLVESDGLYPILEVDVPTDIVAELSRLRAERTELETSKASLESQITLLDKHNKELVSQVKQLSETNTQLANETKSLRNQTRVNKNNLNYTKSYLLEGQKVLEFNQEELQQEQERTKTEQQVQDQQILSSMLASTEIFELVLALMPMQLGNERQSTEGGSKMVEVYVTLIIAGEKTLEQVPALVRPKVEAQLKAMGVLA